MKVRYGIEPICRRLIKDYKRQRISRNGTAVKDGVSHFRGILHVLRVLGMQSLPDINVGNLDPFKKIYLQYPVAVYHEVDLQ